MPAAMCISYAHTTRRCRFERQTVSARASEPPTSRARSRMGCLVRFFTTRPGRWGCALQAWAADTTAALGCTRLPTCSALARHANRVSPLQLSPSLVLSRPLSSTSYHLARPSSSAPTHFSMRVRTGGGPLRRGLAPCVPGGFSRFPARMAKRISPTQTRRRYPFPT